MVPNHVLLVLLPSCILFLLDPVSSHENRPPGIPPYQQQQQQHMHGAQPPSNQGQHHQQQQQQQQYRQPAHGDRNVRTMDMQQQNHGFMNKEAVHDAEHIKEHLKDVVDKPKDQMTDEELEFHYFKLHDYDGNNKLDGTEITKAITHFHDDSDHEKKEGQPPPPPRKVFSDSELVNIVDLVLKEDDLDNDGYIEYAEFVTAQRKAQLDDNKP